MKSTKYTCKVKKIAVTEIMTDKKLLFHNKVSIKKSV